MIQGMPHAAREENSKSVEIPKGMASWVFIVAFKGCLAYILAGRWTCDNSCRTVKPSMLQRDNHATLLALRGPTGHFLRKPGDGFLGSYRKGAGYFVWIF